MNTTVVSLFVGLALGFAGAFGGFTAFIIVLVWLSGGGWTGGSICPHSPAPAGTVIARAVAGVGDDNATPVGPRPTHVAGRECRRGNRR
jgi:hypothetical protein